MLSDRFKRMRSKLPTFFKARFNDDTVLSRLLFILASSIDEAEKHVTGAQDDARLISARTSFPSVVYRAFLPLAPSPDAQLVVHGADGTLLERAESEYQFFYALPDDPSVPDDLHIDHPYFIDPTDGTLYTRRPYGGLIVRWVKEGIESEPILLPLEPVPLWNVLDEFGLELGLPRRPLEPNESYKVRLLDAARAPSGPQHRRLLRAVARDLGWMYDQIWLDGAVDLPLSQPHVLIDTVEVDGEPWPVEKGYYDAAGRWVLRGDPQFNGRTRTVRYLAGLDAQILAEHPGFRDTGGDAQQELMTLLQDVARRAPALWGQVRWDEGYWLDGVPDTLHHLEAVADRW